MPFSGIMCIFAHTALLLRVYKFTLMYVNLRKSSSEKEVLGG